MIDVNVSLPARDIAPTREIKFKKLHPDALLPRYAHGPDEDAGMDLIAIEDTFIVPHNPTLIKTGLAIELPPGIEGQVRSRSGMALKQGVWVPHGMGTIDPGYRGDVGVILYWSPTAAQRKSFEEDKEQYWNPPILSICAGDKIAQLVISRYERVLAVLSDELLDSKRGAGGFGSTGI